MRFSYVLATIVRLNFFSFYIFTSMRKLCFLLCTLVCFAMASAQTRTVKGTVLYAGDDEPLVGATVLPVGAGQGTATDIDGNFSLNIPSTVNKLKVSYVGMNTQEVSITGTPPL